MPRGLYGKILSLDLEFLIPSFRNGLQFDIKAFKRYCCELGIKNRNSTPAYPQRNEQAKAVNMVIMNGLKKRLDDAKSK